MQAGVAEVLGRARFNLNSNRTVPQKHTMAWRP